jgi:alpha-L-fucosidase 2
MVAGFWTVVIGIPDTTLEKQWYRELYKFGSASRRTTPITLQAVWTADNSGFLLERGLPQ